MGLPLRRQLEPLWSLLIQLTALSTVRNNQFARSVASATMQCVSTRSFHSVFDMQSPPGSLATDLQVRGSFVSMPRALCDERGARESTRPRHSTPRPPNLCRAQKEASKSVASSLSERCFLCCFLCCCSSLRSSACGCPSSPRLQILSNLRHPTVAWTVDPIPEDLKIARAVD